MKTVSVIGCGNLGSVIAEGVANQLSDCWKLLGVYDINAEAAHDLAEKYGCTACDDADGLLAMKPDLVVEAAGPVVLKLYAEKVLEAGCDLIPLSVGAFADADFFARVKALAEEKGRKVYVVSGAIGGLDIMQSALVSGGLRSRIVTEKAPRSLKGAPWFDEHPLDESKTYTVFSGNAVDAIKGFPKNVNVAVATALATVGPENTEVVLVSIPGKTTNTHRIELDADFGRATVEIESHPSAANPRSSILAGLSVIAKLKNLASAVSFI